MNRFIGTSPGRSLARAVPAVLRPRSRSPWQPSLAVRFRRLAAGVAFVIPVAMVVPSMATQAAVAPAGNGFVVTAGDLSFILKQIKIAERHSATCDDVQPRAARWSGPAADQIPDRLTSYGLRTVDGSCNNLFPGRENFAAADQPFPRLTDAVFRDAEDSPPDFFGPAAGTGPEQQLHAEVAGNVVVDSQPRVISNLIVDQTSTNPAAVAAAALPVRTQRQPGDAVPCTTDPRPARPPATGVPGRLRARRTRRCSSRT